MVAVRYHCPRCGTLAVLDRDAYLSDKSVTPYPLDGWTYAAPADDYERDAFDGVRFVCGESDCEWEPPVEGANEAGVEGCGEPFYLNFVRYEGGEEVAVEGERESESVELAEGRVPSGPSGPSGPGGPTNR